MTLVRRRSARRRSSGGPADDLGIIDWRLHHHRVDAALHRGRCHQVLVTDLAAEHQAAIYRRTTMFASWSSLDLACSSAVGSQAARQGKIEPWRWQGDHAQGCMSPSCHRRSRHAPAAACSSKRTSPAWSEVPAEQVSAKESNVRSENSWLAARSIDAAARRQVVYHLRRAAVEAKARTEAKRPPREANPHVIVISRCPHEGTKTVST